ncbi:MAG TPA: antibiotic biosynthesis monooxygenase [Gemmatimonadaceae bacterium]
MILRTWKARAKQRNVESYVRHFRELVVPTLTKLPGFLGVSVAQRTLDEDIEIVVTSRWESIEAIHGFAGRDIGVAVVEPAAAAVLESYDRHVDHFATIYEV